MFTFQNEFSMRLAHITEHAGFGDVNLTMKTTVLVQKYKNLVILLQIKVGFVQWGTTKAGAIET
jgi:hypothetical protein